MRGPISQLTIARVHDETLRRWEEKAQQQMAEEEFHSQPAAQQHEIEAVQVGLGDVHKPQSRTTAEPKSGHEFDDVMPFQISQVLMVLNGCDRKEQELKQAREELADARGQIARQQVQVAALMVALMKSDALPSSMTEKELHEYLASSSVDFGSDEIAALNDVPEC